MNAIHTLATFAAVSFTAVACGGTTAEPSGQPKAAAADLLYVGSCDPAACEGLAVSDVGCASGDPTYVCRPANEGKCTIDVQCDADPNGTTSFSSCEDSACGPYTQPRVACPQGYAWNAPQCGKLNQATTCSWGSSCVKQPASAIHVDPSKIGKECGVDANQHTIQCDGSAQCVSLPSETGIEGAHCVQDPCSLLGCPSNKCISLDSYPAQVQCAE